MNHVSLDLRLATRAAEIAIEYRLRGADAVYVVVAEEFNSILISWDAEMLQRSPESMLTMSPEEWLKGPTGTKR